MGKKGVIPLKLFKALLIIHLDMNSKAAIIARHVNCMYMPQRIYKPHYDYQNFSSLANGVYFIAVTR